MNKFILALVAVSSAVVYSGCNEAQRLADNIEGVWSGAPEHLIDKSAASATFLPTFDFDRQGSSNGGDVTLSAMVSVTSQVNGSDAIETPWSMTASATASIVGKWEAVSDDDVLFTWDDKSIEVVVDPNAVVLSQNAITGESSPSVDSIKPLLAESLKTQIARAVEVKFLGMHRLDDIEIHRNGVMECEINDVDYSLRRQGVPQ